MEGLDQRCTVEPGEAFFARLPDQPAVFLVELETPGAQPYLGRTASLQRALRQLLDPAAPATSRSGPVWPGWRAASPIASPARGSSRTCWSTAWRAGCFRPTGVAACVCAARCC